MNSTATNSSDPLFDDDDFISLKYSNLTLTVKSPALKGQSIVF